MDHPPAGMASERLTEQRMAMNTTKARRSGIEKADTALYRHENLPERLPDATL